MKKLLSTLLIIGILFSGCADRKVIGSVEYDTYGLFDKNDKENPEIAYSVSWGNVFWGVVLIETILAPIYFFGYALFEPDGYKNHNPKMKGVVNAPLHYHEMTTIYKGN